MEVEWSLSTDRKDWGHSSYMGEHGALGIASWWGRGLLLSGREWSTAGRQQAGLHLKKASQQQALSQQ